MELKALSLELLCPQWLSLTSQIPLCQAKSSPRCTQSRDPARVTQRWLSRTRRGVPAPLVQTGAAPQPLGSSSQPTLGGTDPAI